MSAIPKVTEPAPAKVNLTLHVTGRRADGYHLLDSLVVFVDVADQVSVAVAPEMSLTVSGPRAQGVPSDRRNLVWQAAEAMQAGPVALSLTKLLPAAAGIGGGSADAAATLRAMARLHGADMPDAAGVLALGADVPVCLHRVPVRMRGVGEQIIPVAGMPALWLVLVNPGVELATPDVFRALEVRSNPPMAEPLPGWPDANAFCDWLAAQRNDLQAPAARVAPVVNQVLTALGAQAGCAVARMSGSGATCFGLFTTADRAEAARAALAQSCPDWWVAAGAVLPCSARDGRSGQTTRATT